VLPHARPTRRRLGPWSLAPAVLATGLLAAGIGGADHVTRAEKAVAARLSWCGVPATAMAKEQVRWQGQSTVAGQIASVVSVSHLGLGTAAGAGLDTRLGARAASASDDASYTVIASPRPGGGWRVVPADRATADALGDCLDHPHNPR
jgi:hypothetical protein